MRGRVTHRGGRRGVATAACGVAALAVTLTACAPVVDEDWQPQGWPAVADVRVVDAPPPVDVRGDTGVAASLTPVRIRNDAVSVQARAAFLPGATAFNDAVEALVREVVDAAASASGARYEPTPFPRGAGLGDRECAAGSTTLPAAEVLADPELGPAGGSGTAIVCDIVAAAGGILGQRIRVVTGSAEGVASDTSAVLYVDTATGETAAASGLWRAGAAETLGAQIVDAVRRDAGALSLAPASAGDDAQLAAITEALATTVLTPDGLVFTIAPGFTAPELAALGVAATSEPLSVEVPRAVAESLVTPFGERALAAAGAAYSAPPAVGAGWHDCTLLPCVAVTFDDGPSAFTASVLDALAARDSVATFFVLGQNAAGAGGILSRMTAEGNEVENHTWNHPNLTELTPEQVSAQIRDTSRVVEQGSGRPVRVFRPPYGEYTGETLAAAGMAAILWDVDTHDYQRPSEDVLIARAVDAPRAGSIVLMHDIHETTARATPAIIDGLLDRGFSLVTVEQLFGGELPSTGAWRRAP